MTRIATVTKKRIAATVYTVAVFVYARGMDIQSKVIYLNADDEFTDKLGHRHKVSYRGVWDVDTPKGGRYVYVEGQGYPEFYMWDDPVTIHVPDAKFQPGDWVVARSGQGAVYSINRVAKDRYGVYYVFDNGSVHIAKRARSGRHYADRADLGYKKLSDEA